MPAICDGFALYQAVINLGKSISFCQIGYLICTFVQFKRIDLTIQQQVWCP